MNIHIKDRELFQNLFDSTMFQVLVGSHMYGLNNKNSDKDYLCIYYPSEYQLMSAFSTNHQLQYTEDNTDFIFVDLITFVKNLVSGDSTINFEVINHTPYYLDEEESLKDTFLGELYKLRNHFKTFQIARAYLGLARRDLNYLSKSDNKIKQYQHIYRGRLIAEAIINNWEIPTNFSHLKNRWKSKSFDYSYNSYQINQLRSTNSERLANKDCFKVLEPKIQKQVDILLQQCLLQNQDYMLKENIMNLFYPYKENPIFKYE